MVCFFCFLPYAHILFTTMDDKLDCECANQNNELVLW